MDAAQAVPAHRQKVLRSAWGRKFWFDPQLPSDLIEAFLTGHEDRLVAGSAGLQVKDRTVVVRHDHPQGSFVLKRHVWGGLSRTLRMSHRVSAAKRCACLGEMLAAHGIPTPPVRANLELGWGPFSYRSYLLADYVEGRSLFQLIRFEDCGETQLNSLARQVADIWRQLIALNVSHNDLKPENFIVDDQQKVWLIDFEKLRFHRSPAKMRRRHLEDLRIFLHPRNWRGQEAASDIFRRELLKTPLGGYASATRPAEGGRPDHTVQASAPRANKISVAIVVGEGEWNQASIEQTARSVRSMADEIAVVRLDERGEGFEVLEPQLPPHLRDRRGAMGRSAQFRRTQDRQLHNPWVLLMEAGEQATPDLMRELPELLEDRSDFDAVRLPVDEIYFGCSTRPHREPDSAPIRLFRQGTTFRIDDLDQLALTIESARVICFSRKINRHVYSTWGELIVELDQRAADLADGRFQRADRPRLVAGAAKAALGCMRDVIWRRQYRGGWLGLQIAVTKSFFDWVVEAKLWQRANSFHSIPAAASAGSVTTQEAPPARKTKAA